MGLFRKKEKEERPAKPGATAAGVARTLEACAKQLAENLGGMRPEWAGVMFTADPVTGRRSELVIESGPGLGDALVMLGKQFQSRGIEVERTYYHCAACGQGIFPPG